jgi:hypothetical protein
MKSSLERQAAENSALAARDMAMLSRDVLMSKADVMKQASDNVMLVQLDALKNKDALANQLHCTYEKLSALNTDRIRDNLADYRAEYTGLKYYNHGHHGHHGHHPDVHNNLYAGVGRREDRDGGFGR